MGGAYFRVWCLFSKMYGMCILSKLLSDVMGIVLSVLSELNKKKFKLFQICDVNWWEFLARQV